MVTIELPDTALATATTEAALAGLPVERWIELLIATNITQDPDLGMDDMGFPSPRNPTGTQTHPVSQGVLAC